MLHKKHSHIASFLNSVVNKAFHSQVNRRQIVVNQAPIILAESYFFSTSCNDISCTDRRDLEDFNDDKEVIQINSFFPLCHKQRISKYNNHN